MSCKLRNLFSLVIILVLHFLSDHKLKRCRKLKLEIPPLKKKIQNSCKNY